MKIWEVETPEDFKKYLHELSEHSEVGPLYYQAIADTFDKLYEQLGWVLRLAFVFGFVLGIVFSYLLRMVIGGF